MINSADQLIYKASLLIDEGDLEGAEACLRDAIQLAEVTGRKVGQIQATMLLAELLLHRSNGEEGLEHCEDIIEMANDPSIDRAEIDAELRAARGYLAQAMGLE